MRISRLTLQNFGALITFALYLLARPWLRLLGQLRPGQSEQWVIGGHSGRLYADNSAALHELLLREGRQVAWISADPRISAELARRGARVLSRNSLRARLAIENAQVLIYSHGLTDLDHVLVRCVTLSGLKVHLNHCMCYLKRWRTTPLRPWPGGRRPRSAREPFDYFLANSERERQNVARSFPGAEARVIVGGGAHLDAFMRARGRAPERLITYFPTFRESRSARAALDAQIDALTRHPKLLAWLEREDYRLCVARHVNRSGAAHGQGRVRFAAPDELMDVVLGSAVLISDYSGLLCDFLALDRPTLFFPFDKEEYLRARPPSVDYDAFMFGPCARDVDSLVTLITDPRALRPAGLEARRRYWTRELFPELRPVYARRTLATIERLLASDGEAVVLGELVTHRASRHPEPAQRAS